jgi:predicted nucleotidyltransferase
MDIFKITNSKIREAVFQLYFSHPEKKYYLRELERILNLPVQNIRRELISLEKSGVFQREKMGNQVYYFLNTKSPIFKELRGVVSKTIGIENNLKMILSDMDNIKFAFIFGSFANETEDAMSDIDLMIIGNVNENNLIGKISTLETKIEREINYHIFGEAEFKKRLSDKDAFIKGILSKPTIFLIGNYEDISRIN